MTLELRVEKLEQEVAIIKTGLTTIVDLLGVVPEVPDTEAPTITLTPFTGTQSGTITLVATVDDNKGVTSVLYSVDQGASNLYQYTANAAPFIANLDTTTLLDGAYVLSATAFDAAGNSSVVSVALNIAQPDTEAPTITLTPFVGAQSGAITLAATVSDNVGVTQVNYNVYDSVGTNQLAVTTTVPPFSSPFDTTALPDGGYTVTATAWDAAGNTSATDTIGLIIAQPDTEAPTITLNPLVGTQSGTITLSSMVSDNVEVTQVDYDVYDSGDMLAHTISSVTSPFDGTLDTTTLPDGSYTVIGEAIDAAGNQSSSLPIDLVIAQPDIEAPVISITTDLTGNLSGSVDIEVAASDNVGVTLVHLVVAGAANPEGVVRASNTVAPFTTTLDTTVGLPDGDYTLWVVAYDGAGNLGESTHIPITILNTVTPVGPAPNCSILAITEPTPYAGDLPLTIKTVDNGAGDVIKVELVVDSVIVAETTTFVQVSTTRRDFNLTFDTTTLTDGDHIMLAIATDIAGNTKDSYSLNMPVDNAAPVPDTEAPVITLTNTQTEYTGTEVFSFTASDNVGVTQVDLLIDDVLRGTLLTTPIDFTYDTALLTDGAHVVKGIAHDAAGNTTTSNELTINVTNTTPGPTPTPTPTPTPGTVNESLDAFATQSDNLLVLINTDVRQEAVDLVTAITELRTEAERMRDVIDAGTSVQDKEDAKLWLNDMSDEFIVAQGLVQPISVNELNLLKDYSLSVTRDIITLMSEL